MRRWLAAGYEAPAHRRADNHHTEAPTRASPVSRVRSLIGGVVSAACPACLAEAMDLPCAVVQDAAADLVHAGDVIKATDLCPLCMTQGLVFRATVGAEAGRAIL
jgi:hypothetical protein